MDEPITKIVSNQLDIKLGQFTQEELDSVLRKIKNRKVAGLDEIMDSDRSYGDLLQCSGCFFHLINIFQGTI